MRVHSKPAPTIPYPVDRPLRPVTTLSSTPAQSTSSTAKPSATPSAPTTTASAKPSSAARGGSSGSANNSEEANAIAAVYSTTIGGETYSGTVEGSNGTYTASIANLPGASAAGSSVQGAEDNLGSIIDVIA